MDLVSWISSLLNEYFTNLLPNKSLYIFIYTHVILVIWYKIVSGVSLPWEAELLWEENPNRALFRCFEWRKCAFLWFTYLASYQDFIQMQHTATKINRFAENLRRTRVVVRTQDLKTDFRVLWCAIMWALWHLYVTALRILEIVS